jgi:hypothetical protein
MTWNDEHRTELAQRATDGIEVQLLWSRRSNTLAVAVHDSRARASFELVVDDGAEALDVFDHPYAHAAWRGVELAEAA